MPDDKTQNNTLDITTDYYIRRMYRDEYKDMVHPELKGFAGWFKKKQDAVFKKIEKLGERSELLMTAATLATGLSPLYVLVGLMLLNPMAGMIFFAGAVGSMAYIKSKQTEAAEAALTRDIANGTLLQRYKADILSPQLVEVEQKLGNLAVPGKAAAAFNAADTAQKHAADEKPQITLRMPPPGM